MLGFDNYSTGDSGGPLWTREGSGEKLAYLVIFKLCTTFTIILNSKFWSGLFLQGQEIWTVLI